ncbi:hypothetical protein WSM22_37810 [Cytophagales bacterium WSM2-2]|nr:hypothetical protein WSM22_37810 [Cytophagales bacterium WSM2-2]
MSAPNTKEKTSTVKAARDGLDHELTVLASMVEAAANDPAVRDDQRVPIVQSAGMDVKSKGGGKSKLQFAVAQGGSSGSVILTAEAGARGHEWRSTPDIEKYENQTPLATTTLSRVEVTGLTVGIKMAFFHRPIIPGKNTDWEGPIIFEIK